MDRFVEQVRAWSAAHPPSGRVVRNAEELRRLVAAEERERQAETLVLKDEPPHKKH